MTTDLAETLAKADRLVLRHDVARWALSALVVVAVHAGAVTLALSQLDGDGEIAGNQYVTVELDAEPAAPVIGQAEAVQGVQQIQTEETSQASVAQEEVRETVEKHEEAVQAPLMAEREPEVVVPEVKPEEEQAEKKKQAKSEARIESAPMSAPMAAQQYAAQAVMTRGIETDDRASFMSWRTLLASHVQRYKRYPAEALARSLHGVTMVSFTIDRQGRLVGSAVRTSSGASILDSEALTLIARATPLPPAPDNVAGDKFTFAIPIRFNPPK